MSPHVLYDVADRIGIITLNRPEVLNAFGGTMREDLLAAVRRAESDAQARCLVITGAGDAFCAGGDVASMVALQDKNDVSVVQQRMVVGGEVVQALRRLPKPVIAAVNGAAAGAGMNLALACDLRYASEKARFAESFVKIGLVPDWGGHFLLTQLVGTARAMELMMTGDRLDAADALRLGLVNRVFPHASFRDDVLAVARRLAEGPAGTLAQIKHGVYVGAAGTLGDALAHEAEAQTAVFLSADAREGMRAFVEKRRPRFGP
jgi:2-(1,2-epoxy-1,2-dihydrophenyl)acetyl-CoA isomerase